jgi:hypothetical protein
MSSPNVSRIPIAECHPYPVGKIFLDLALQVLHLDLF